MCIKKAGYKYYILLKILHMFCLLRQPKNIKKKCILKQNWFYEFDHVKNCKERCKYIVL